MERVAAQNVAAWFVQNFVLAGVTTGSPERHPSCRLHRAFVEGTRHVGGCFCVALTRGASPMPALIWTFDVNLEPEVANGPIHVEIKIADIDGAPALLDFLHTVQAVSHESKVAFMRHVALVVPGAAKILVLIHFFLNLFSKSRVCGKDFLNPLFQINRHRTGPGRCDRQRVQAVYRAGTT